MEVGMSVVILLAWFTSIMFPFIISGSNHKRYDDEETKVTVARKNSHFLKG